MIVAFVHAFVSPCLSCHPFCNARCCRIKTKDNCQFGIVRLPIQMYRSSLCAVDTEKCLYRYDQYGEAGVDQGEHGGGRPGGGGGGDPFDIFNQV